MILISGPVASGKTTLAWRLAALARAHGISPAAIDMDEMVAIVAGRDWSLVTEMHRQSACDLAGTVAQQLFDGGVQLVAIAGSTVSGYEWERVRSHIRSVSRPTRILLRASLEEAVRRAGADLTRGATRNPDLVSRLYFAVDWSVVPSADIELSTDGLNQDEVSRTIWARLQPDIGSPS